MKTIKTFTTFSGLFLISSTLFAAPLSTDTGFVYPANMKHADSHYFAFGDKSPNIGNRCHLANDYDLPEGRPVYATDDGVVDRLNTAIPFYGSSTGATGGAMVIKHKTSSGVAFYGLYGHIKEMSVKVGETVHRGQQIAKIGHYTSGGKLQSHLHFGINTKEASYFGYTPTTACRNYLNFVDPEQYMHDHYTRAGSCKAVDNRVTTTKNLSVDIPNVLANDSDVDGDTLVLSAVDQISKQGEPITNNGDGTFRYTPAIDYVGVDSFKYTITDNKGCKKQATVYIEVKKNQSGGGEGTGEGSGKDNGGGGSFNPFALLGFFLLLLVRRFRKV